MAFWYWGGAGQGGAPLCEGGKTAPPTGREGTGRVCRKFSAGLCRSCALVGRGALYLRLGFIRSIGRVRACVRDSGAHPPLSERWHGITLALQRNTASRSFHHEDRYPEGS